MKIVVAGNFLNAIYARALSKAFSDLGHDVLDFDWFRYFEKRTIFTRFQFKFHRGPLIKKTNKDLINFCKLNRPGLLFIYRGIFITKKTIDEIKNNGTIVIGYNNDDPFNKKYKRYVWRTFLKSVYSYDFIYSFRQTNIIDYKEIGIQSELLRIYYIKDRNFHIPMDSIDNSRYVCDVIFVGHYENDGRDEMLYKLMKEGISVKIFGSEWKNSKFYDFFRDRNGCDLVPLNEDYNLAMNSSKIVLCFLSKLNNDTYTTRNFEIPATKQFMLSEYSEDLCTMFKPNVEAVYFKNCDELISKVKYYLSHEKERKSIAENGYERLLKDCHEIKDRCNQIISKYESIRRKQK